MRDNLVEKYTISIPKYTNYPTASYGERSLSKEQLKIEVKKSFDKINSNEGIGVYIHLPFCQGICAYCGDSTVKVANTIEPGYIKAILKEWSIYIGLFQNRPRISEIHLGGGTQALFSPANLKELIEGILSKADVCENAEFSFEGHPNNTSDKHLKMLRSLGFSCLSMGIQDFDAKMKNVINRIQTFENVERVTKEARGLGYKSISYDLIYGLPLQEKSSIINTINKIHFLRPDRISLYSYSQVPWLKNEEGFGLENNLPDNEGEIELCEASHNMLEKVGYVEIGMDQFVLKSDSLYKTSRLKKLHRNFMGYTNNHTEFMLGLGISAVSDTWYTSAQNVNSLNEYYHMLNEDKLPILKGHLLSEEGLVMRKHILNVMCRFETSWIDKDDQVKGLYDALIRLKQMESDGLIQRFPYKLIVTEEGKKFIRNICMAFDTRLWRATPTGMALNKAI